MLVRNSRREFLAGAAAAAAATSVAAAAGPILAYAGTYSAPVGAEGAPGRGKGVYLFEMKPATGALTERALFPNAANPSCLALNTVSFRARLRKEPKILGNVSRFGGCAQFESGACFTKG